MTFHTVLQHQLEHEVLFHVSNYCQIEGQEKKCLKPPQRAVEANRGHL